MTYVFDDPIDVDTDEDIEDIADLVKTNGGMLYYNTDGSRYNETPSVSFGRSLLNGASASAVRTLLELGTASTVTLGTNWATLLAAARPTTAAGYSIANGAVLDATTASFTTADEAKLDGIEALADVTDAANVAAAGALMAASLGTGVQTALGVNVGSAGAPVVNGGALGTPASGVLTNCEVTPTNEATSESIPDLFGGYRWNAASLFSTMVVVTRSVTTGNIDSGTDQITWTDHGRWTGEGCYVTAGDGLTALTQVYYIRWVDDDTISLHPTCEDALSGTNKVNITGTTAFDLNILRDPKQGIYKVRSGDALSGADGALVQQIAGEVSPRHFGGVKGLVDNSAAIMAAFNFMRYSWNSSKHAFDVSVNFEAVQYYCTRPVHIVNLRQPDAAVYNGGIYSTATGKIALCLAGMNSPIFEDFEVFCDQTSSPAVGMYYGRSWDGSTAPIAPDARFSNVRVQGFASQSGVVNFACETESLVNCSFNNEHRSLTAVSGCFISNMQTWVDQFGSELASDFCNLPPASSGLHSNILHQWTQPRFTRASVIAMPIVSITKANPAVVTVNAAELLASGLGNGNPVFIDVSGMVELTGTVQTIANIDTGAGTFELSGVDSSAYTTFTSGHARNKTGPSLIIGGAYTVFGRSGYHLTYGSPSIIFDLPNGPPSDFQYDFQDENNPDQPVLFRTGSGSHAIQGFDVTINSWSQNSANNIIGYEGTGTVLLQNVRIVISNMSVAPAADLFESPGQYSLVNANISVPLAAALNAPSAFAAFSGETTAFDRTPKTIRYGGETFVGQAPLALQYDDDGAGAGPDHALYRNSASPASNDVLGRVLFQGNSSTGVKRSYATLRGRIQTATNGAENAFVDLVQFIAGAETATHQWRQGLFTHLKTYTVATLPGSGAGAAAGSVAYAADLRVFDGAGTQQGAGTGTGGMVIFNGTNWKNFDAQSITAVA